MKKCVGTAARMGEDMRDEASEMIVERLQSQWLVVDNRTL
jgi:hypothetical protein